MASQNGTDAVQATRMIAIDASYAPEVVEFWAKKYQDVKDECESLKRHYATQPDRDDLRREQNRLKELIIQMQEESRRREADERKARQDADSKAAREVQTLQTRMTMLEKEKEALNVRLMEKEKAVAAATQQVLKFYGQCTVLALEEDQSRHEKVEKMFEPVQFFDKEMDYRAVVLSTSKVGLVSERLHSRLELPNFARTYNSKATAVRFLPRPPNSMPLRIRACAQHGYWFCPIYPVNPGQCFELVVEGDPDQWLYLGSYESLPMEGAEMRLSEWLMLDENTKLAHCLRAASQELPKGQFASYPAQLDVKRRYEMGEWSVPCYALRCVGFSTDFYAALQAEPGTVTATGAPGGNSTPVATQIVVPTRRAVTGSFERVDMVEEVVGRGHSAKRARIDDGSVS